jgi:hypothetical protein
MMEIVREALLLAQVVAKQLNHVMLLHKIKEALSELNEIERRERGLQE